MQNYVDFLLGICCPPNRLSVIFERYLKIDLSNIAWTGFNEDENHNVSFESKFSFHETFTSIGILFRSIPKSVEREDLDHYFHAYIHVDEDSSLHALRNQGSEFNVDVLGVMPAICFEADVATFEIEIERGRERPILNSMIGTERKLALWAHQERVWQQ